MSGVEKKKEQNSSLFESYLGDFFAPNKGYHFTLK